MGHCILMMYNQTAAKESVDIIENIFFLMYMYPHWDINTGKQIGLEGVGAGGMTFHLMVLFHHTKLGFRKFNHEDGTVWTSINWNLVHLPWLLP